MISTWNFSKNRYPKLRRFEVLVTFLKNGKNSVLLDEVDP
jgi:hypothetical protein